MAMNSFSMASTKTDENKRIKLPENKDILSATGLLCKSDKVGVYFLLRRLLEYTMRKGL